MRKKVELRENKAKKKIDKGRKVKRKRNKCSNIERRTQIITSDQISFPSMWQIKKVNNRQSYYLASRQSHEGTAQQCNRRTSVPHKILTHI